MNGEEFYGHYKEILNFLGLEWGQKAKMDVGISGNKIWFSYDGKTVSLTL